MGGWGKQNHYRIRCAGHPEGRRNAGARRHNPRRKYIKGSFLSFVSTDSNSSVTVNGIRTPLPAGSHREDPCQCGHHRDHHAPPQQHPELQSCRCHPLYERHTGSHGQFFGDCLIPSVRNYHANLTFAIEPTYRGGHGRSLSTAAKSSPGRRTPTSSSQRIRRKSRERPYLSGSSRVLRGKCDPVHNLARPDSRFYPPHPQREMPRSISRLWIARPALRTPWSWDFGDGTSSEEQNPTHLYASPGSYAVTLTVKNGDQTDRAVKEDAVIVTPPRVVANFYSQPARRRGAPHRQVYRSIHRVPNGVELDFSGNLVESEFLYHRHHRL